jgi:transposase InsO family protein
MLKAKRTKNDNKLKLLHKRLFKKEIGHRRFKTERAEIDAKQKEINDMLSDVSYKREDILCEFIKDAQDKFYHREIEILKANKQLPHRHPLSKIIPIIDKNGIMRTTTRISNSKKNRDTFTYNLIHQIILPPDSHLTKLIILQYHINNAHIHNHTVVIQLQQKYFIPHINWNVKKTLKELCWKCKMNFSKPVTPMMGDLPIERLCDHQPPFSKIIIDVAGHFWITNKRKTEKRWLLVISCLTTRAIHIEILHSLTTDSAIKSLQNCFALRGRANVIYSDNGLNFVGAIPILKDALNEENKLRIQQGLDPITIEWITSPAHAPHMNGSIERLIGLTKNALKKVEKLMNEKLYTLDDESFRAVICSVIGIINNRPLCIAPITGTTNSFLTPNHFLMGRENFSLTPSADNPKLISKYYADIQQINGILWKHWLKAYVPTILYRQKWVKRTKPIEKGEIIITQDPTITNSWRLGRVIEIIEGSQNQVRKLKIMLGKNSMSFDNRENRSAQSILKKYKEEKVTIITRPVTAVASVDLKAVVLTNEV